MSPALVPVPAPKLAVCLSSHLQRGRLLLLLSEEDEEYHKGEDEELAGIEEIGAHIDEDEDDLPPSPKFDHPPAAANDGPAPMDTDDAPAAPAAAKKLTFTFGKKK